MKLGWIAFAASLSLVSVACVTPEPESDESGDVASHAQALNGSEGGKGSNDKVVVCHIPPGNHDNAHSIKVGAAALSAHLAHGDILGSCDGSDGGGSEPSEGGGGDPAPACREVYSACGADTECCSNSCFDGACIATNVCIKLDTVDQVCDPANPCCDGNHCIAGTCYAAEDISYCAGTGEAYNLDDEENPVWCCWNLGYGSDGKCQ